MPELPEVEYAASIARRVAVGRTIKRVRVLHAAQRRSLSAAAARRIAGDRVLSIQRRGKYQVLHLASGRALVVHFRMTGDWEALSKGEALPAHARVVVEFTDGAALALVDSRALGTVTLHDAGAPTIPDLGPEAIDSTFSAGWLAERFRSRRGPVKVALLDQRVVAGIGNIYASEALWYARLDPRIAASRLTTVQLRHLVSGVRRALRKAMAHPERYYNGASSALRFNVYDREGKACRRCGAPIQRLVQAARSTYYCGGCQSR